MCQSTSNGEISMRSNSAWLFLVVTVLCVQPSQSENGTPAKVTVPKRTTPVQQERTTAVQQAKLSLPIPDNSLWLRYYQAGEDASLTQHDAGLAKKYWMAAKAGLD